MLKRLVRLWRRVFSVSAGKDEVAPSLPPCDISPSPEPSCFIRGIANSIVREPEKWKSNTSNCHPIGYWILDIDHEETETRVKLYSNNKEIYIDGRSVSNPTEFQYLCDTIMAHPLGQLKEELDRKRQREEQLAQSKAYFETLGCPPITPPSP